MEEHTAHSQPYNHGAFAPFNMVQPAVGGSHTHRNTHIYTEICMHLSRQQITGHVSVIMRDTCDQAVIQVEFHLFPFLLSLLLWRIRTGGLFVFSIPLSYLYDKFEATASRWLA